MGAGLSSKAKESLKNCEKEGKTELNFSDCGISVVKNFRPVLRLKNLTYLNLEHNVIIELPNQFDKLRFLRHINLRDNRLEELNSGILVMDGLEKLNVAQNKLINLPEPISKLSSLTDIDLSYNEIREVPKDFGKLKLKRLAYAGNKLKVLPPVIWECTAVTHLNIRDNQLTTLPDELAKMSNLTYLDCANNQLQELSACVGKLVKLKHLDVSENQLEKLPTDLCNCVDLTVLKVSNNKLVSFVSLEHFDHFKKLEDLIADHNRLKALHPLIGNMESLRNVDLSYNQMENAPKQLGWLGKTLRKLVLSFNQLKMLPGDFTYLNPALRLELEQNPLDPVVAMNYKKGVPLLLDSLANSVLAYPPHCVAYGDALVSGKAGVGECFQIKAFDRQKKEIKSGKDTFEAKMVKVVESEADEPFEYQCIVKNLKNGEYKVFYNVQQTGLFKTHITNEDTPILGSPFETVLEPGLVDPNQCSAAGKGLIDSTAGSTVSFSIITRDKFKNGLEVGGAKIRVEILGGSNPVPKVTDNNDGSYLVAYTLGWADTYHIEVYINEIKLEGSPFTIQVSE